MKYFRLLALCLAIFAIIGLCSCGESQRLDAPSGVDVEYETLALTWDSVKGAMIYTVRIESDGAEPVEATVSRNYYMLDGLAAGSYTITVTAGDTSNEKRESKPSDPVHFDRDNETGLVFALINGGTEYEVSDKGSATGKIEIPSTYRKKPVTSVGDRVFFAKTDVTEVKLPETITNVGNFAFANCTYLNKINLPSGLLKLGESSFSGCRMLEGSITLPSEIKEIPKGAFAYCSKLEEVIFGQSVSSIGDNAFSDCSGIKSLALPRALKSLGNFAFAACSGIESVTFNTGLESIGEFAFSKAISIDEVSLPDSVKSIGVGAFYYCSSISSVDLGRGIESIGHSAFLDTALYSVASNEVYVDNWFICLKEDNAVRVDIKDGTVGVADNAFYACREIKTMKLPASVKRIGSLAFAASGLVEVIIGSGVEYIADQAFLYCEYLYNVVLGAYDYDLQTMSDSSLKQIGNYAFMNCSALEGIVIPDTVEDIGSYAFRNTALFTDSLTGLVYAGNWLVDFNENIKEDVVIADNTKGIARYSFYNCGLIESVKIPGSVEYIGRGAFYNCSSLQRVTLPDALTRIEDYTFYSCSNLVSVTLPPMLKEIGRSAFYKCGTVKNYDTDTENDILEIPSSVTYIGDYAFYGCGYREADAISGDTVTGGIDVLRINGQLEYIGRCAFYRFKSLRSVTVSGALMIGDKAFFECPTLEDVTVLSTLTTVGDKAFYACPSLKNVNLPDSAKKVGDYAFYMCESLAKVDTGSALESIGEYAFFGDYSLSDIYLPATLKSVGEQAFRGCDSITSLTLGASIEYIGSHAFYSCDALTIYSSLSLESDTWSKYWNSTFVPVIWGAELSTDGTYVISVTVKDGFITNDFIGVKLSEPTRPGYVFVGWSANSSASSAEYSQDKLTELAGETKLYSVWQITE